MPADSFKTRYDSSDSIGGCGCGGCPGCSESIGFSFGAAASGGLGGLAGEVSKQADAELGKAAAKLGPAKDAVDKAMATGQGVSDAVEAFEQAEADVGGTIEAIATNPATHAVLGAVAVAAPPFSTIAAGLAEAGLAIAVWVEQSWDDISTAFEDAGEALFGCDSPCQAMRAYERKKAREAIRTQAKLAGHKVKVTKALAAKELAALKAKAVQGDRKALASVVALEQLMKEHRLMRLMQYSVWQSQRLQQLAKQGCTPAMVKEAKAKKTIWNAKAGLCAQQLTAVVIAPKAVEKVIDSLLVRKAMTEWRDIEAESNKLLAETLRKKAELKKQQVAMSPARKGISMPAPKPKEELVKGVAVLPGGKPTKAVFRRGNGKETYLVQASGRILWGPFERV